MVDTDPLAIVDKPVSVEEDTQEPKPKKRRASKSQNGKVQSSRTIGQASRTLQACALCRKQKTRCFRSPENPESCLRCTFINAECSFKNSLGLVFPVSNTTGESEKLTQVMNGINEVLSILKSSTNGSGRSNGKIHNVTDLTPAHATEANEEQNSTIIDPVRSHKISPFSILNQHIPTNVPSPITRLINPSGKKLSLITADDIIGRDIISYARVIELIDDFRRNFGRWVLFPQELPTPVLVDQIRERSSLLLTSCCCISLRFSVGAEKNQVLYKRLVKHLTKDLNEALFANTVCLNSTSGHIEFLQSLVVLSIYSLSLSYMVNAVSDVDTGTPDDVVDYTNLNLDAWFLSSIGLTACISKSTLGGLVPRELETESQDFSVSVLFDNLSDDSQRLTVFRIYNHLCLLHLINCVFSGRMCTIDEIRINYCLATLNLPSATNFDGRMVSEIGILLITYNYIQLNLNDVRTIEECEAGFRLVREDIDIWYDQWEYLINQPAVQFVEFNYHVCSLIIYYNYSYFKSLLKGGRKPDTAKLYEEDGLQSILPLCDETSLLCMIRHAYEAIRVANGIDSDSYFAYLSDQLHFCFYFAGIVLVSFLRWVADSDALLKKLELSTAAYTGGNSTIDVMVDAVVRLVERLTIILGNNHTDILMAYRDGLHATLTRNFPRHLP